MTSIRNFLLTVGVAAMAVPVVAQEIANEGPGADDCDDYCGVEEPCGAGAVDADAAGEWHPSAINSVDADCAAAAQIAILIDDGLRGSFALQFEGHQAIFDGPAAGGRR